MSLTHKYFRVNILTSSLALLLGIGMAVSLLFTDCEAAPSVDQVRPEMWPMAKSPVGLDATIEKRITGMLRQMSIEEKIGQVIQPEWKTIKPGEVTRYHIGSIENGGGAVPGGNKHATVKDWVDLIEPYYQASVVPGEKVTIPLIWASDAVHGHNNVYGATLFPHNIGLGAAHDPDLIERIGRATAREVAPPGIEW